MLSDGEKISALVQCGSARNDEDKESVPYRNWSVYQIAKSAMDEPM